MMILFKWLLMTLSVGIAAYLLPGISISGFLSALFVALFLGIVNTLVRPLLIIITLPINIITLGFFTFVINAMLVLLASKVVHGFIVKGFWWAMLFSVILSVIQYLLSKIFISHSRG